MGRRDGGATLSFRRLRLTVKKAFNRKDRKERPRRALRKAGQPRGKNRRRSTSIVCPCGVMGRRDGGATVWAGGTPARQPPGRRRYSVVLRLHLGIAKQANRLEGATQTAAGS